MRWALLLALTALYPLIVYFSLGRIEPRYLALLLLVLAGLRLLVKGNPVVPTRWFVLAAGFLAGCTLLLNQRLPLKLYPVAVNMALLLLFGRSLLRGQPMVERLARLHEPELDAQGQWYTRRVTQWWCLFFAFNGFVALATALWATDAIWTLYNGLIAYLLIGLLMGGEWLLRRHLRERQRAAWR